MANENLNDAVKKLEENPFQGWRKYPVAELQAWLQYNLDQGGRNMGLNMMGDLTDYLALRVKAQVADQKIEFYRQKYGWLGATAVGLLHRKDTQIRHPRHK